MDLRAMRYLTTLKMKFIRAQNQFNAIDNLVMWNSVQTLVCKSIQDYNRNISKSLWAFPVSPFIALMCLIKRSTVRTKRTWRQARKKKLMSRFESEKDLKVQSGLKQTVIHQVYNIVNTCCQSKQLLFVPQHILSPVGKAVITEFHKATLSCPSNCMGAGQE